MAVRPISVDGRVVAPPVGRDVLEIRLPEHSVRTIDLTLDAVTVVLRRLEFGFLR